MAIHVGSHLYSTTYYIEVGFLIERNIIVAFTVFCLLCALSPPKKEKLC